MLTTNPEASKIASPLNQPRCLTSLRSQCEDVKPGESITFYYVSEMIIISPSVMSRGKSLPLCTFPETISLSFALGSSEASDRGGRGPCFCARAGVISKAVLFRRD